MRGVTLKEGTVVVLAIDGSLVYVESIQPTHAAVVALPEQITQASTRVFTPGCVGVKKISPYSEADRVLPVDQLSERNQKFLEVTSENGWHEYEVLRATHGPSYVARTPEEIAAMSVTKAAKPKRASLSEAERQQLKADKRAKRRAGKIPCVKCGHLPIHADHHMGTCTYEAPAKKVRTPRGPKRTPAAEATYRVVSDDLTELQAASDKFKPGNRFYRVFQALSKLPDKAGTMAQVIAAVSTDGSRPMSNAEKVTRRALKQLTDAGNATRE